MAAEKTGLVTSIGRAAVSTAVPALPVPGADIDYSAGDFLASWTQIGGKNASGVPDLAESSIGITPVREAAMIKTPFQQNKRSAIIRVNGVESVEFALSEITTQSMGLGSTQATASNVVSTGIAITYYALIFEIGGIGLLYYPKVEFLKPTIAPATAEVENEMIKYVCEVYGTDAVASGEDWYTFNGS